MGKQWHFSIAMNAPIIHAQHKEGIVAGVRLFIQAALRPYALQQLRFREPPFSLVTGV